MTKENEVSVSVIAREVIAALNGSDTTRASAASVVREAMLNRNDALLLALVDAREELPGQTSRTAEVYVRATMAQITRADASKVRKGVTLEGGAKFIPAPALTVRKLGKFSNKREIAVKAIAERSDAEKMLAAVKSAIKNLRDVAAALECGPIALDDAETMQATLESMLAD